MTAAIKGLRVLFLAGSVASMWACSGGPAAAVAAAEPSRVEAAAPAVATTSRSIVQQTSNPAAAQAPRPTAAPATAKPAAKDSLPELVYVCPMPQDLDAVSDKPGKCVKCGMTLFPVRLKQVWSCQSNTAFLSEAPGKCRTDGTEMVPVNASIFWSCPSTPDVKDVNPGKCADGKDRIRKMEVFAHGDHNPKHGGTLFMSDDGWHHLEGTYPSAGLVRAFFYDEFTRPLAAKGFSASAVVKDAAGKEVSTIPMKAGRITNALEAQVPGAKLPFTVQLRVQFKPGDKERRFDFPPFLEYSKEPVAAPTTTTAKPSAPATTTAKPSAAPPPKPAPAPATAAMQVPAPLPGTVSPQQADGADPMRQQQALEIMPDKMIEVPVLPGNSKDLLAELKKSSGDVTSLMDEGKIKEIWVPALRTKDIAIALADHLNEIPERQRSLATSAVNRVVRFAWELDDLGDLGDNEKILGVYTLFTAAVNELTTTYDSVR